MNAMSNSAPWFVAYTNPRAEIAVKAGIEEIGGEVFLPMEKFSRRIEKRNLWKRIERPLFSRYIFCRPYGGRWGKLLEVDGVADILRNNDIPSLIASPWIEALRRAEAYGAFDRSKGGSPDPFAIGEVVRISAGPLSGHSGVIERFIHKMRSTTAKKRARVLLQFMGEQAKFEIDVCDLEKP